MYSTKLGSKMNIFVKIKQVPQNLWSFVSQKASQLLRKLSGEEKYDKEFDDYMRGAPQRELKRKVALEKRLRPLGLSILKAKENR